MVQVNEKLKKVRSEIKKIDSKIEHKQQKQKECVGLRYQKFKVTLVKEISELLIQRSSKQEELSQIVRRTGYKDVSKFMKAFEKACKLLEDYQAQHSDEIKEPERESVLAKLKSYDEAAKNQPSKTSAKNRGKEESL